MLVSVIPAGKITLLCPRYIRIHNLHSPIPAIGSTVGPASTVGHGEAKETGGSESFQLQIHSFGPLRDQGSNPPSLSAFPRGGIVPTPSVTICMKHSLDLTSSQNNLVFADMGCIDPHFLDYGDLSTCLAVFDLDDEIHLLIKGW